MFTGIVEGLGRVLSATGKGTVRITVQSTFDLGRVRVGDSVAVDGVCLTVVARRGRRFDADLGPETLRKTTLGRLEAGSHVHLERALRIGDAIGGHLVTGHVDGRGRVAAARAHGASRTLTIEAPRALAPFIVPKGSITVDGVSLTVNRVDGTRFRVTLIPHTLVVTQLGRLAAGQQVNLETDLIAKHVARLVKPLAGKNTSRRPRKTTRTAREN